MPSFFLLCLNLWRVKPAVTPEPDAVQTIVGNRPASRLSSRTSRPPSRMSSVHNYTPSTASGARKRQHRTSEMSMRNSGVPPSAFRAHTPSQGEFGASRNGAGKQRTRVTSASRSSIGGGSISSEPVSEYRAATVRSVRERYERKGLSEHMRLTHEIVEWKKADDTIGEGSLQNRKSPSARSMPVQGSSARMVGPSHVRVSAGDVHASVWN
jgi:hypothetical protein